MFGACCKGPTCLIFCILMTSHSIPFSAAVSIIPDNSVFWTAKQGGFYYLDSTDTDTWLNQQNPTGISLNYAQISSTNSIFGMSYDFSSDHVMVSDSGSFLISLVNLETKVAWPFHIGASPGVGQLTIDWRARNIYWTDGDYGWIAMKSYPEQTNTVNSFDRSFRIIVDTFLNVPTGIVVHPQEYYLFWADAGAEPKIERSDLVGGGRTVLVWQGLIRPTCLSIHNQTSRLFWSDPDRQTIEYIQFDGTGRTVFVSETGYDYYGVAVFQDRLIYTTPGRNMTGIYSLTDAFSGVSLVYNTPLYYVDVYDEQSQPRAPLEPCDSSQFSCDQICVHMENDPGATCFCEDGYDLITETQCQANRTVLERHLLFTLDNKICATSINVIYSPASDLKPNTDCTVVQHSQDITRFTVDMNEDYIFYTDGVSIYKQLAFSSSRTILHTGNNTILDLDFDWKTRELFWVESDTDHIFYKNTEEPGSAAIQSPASPHPATNLAVNPHNNRVFWISHTGNSYKLYMWNRVDNSVTEITTSALSNPTDIEYDRANDRVVWNDDRFYGIISPDGSGVQKINTFPDLHGVRHGIAVYKGVKRRHCLTVGIVHAGMGKSTDKFASLQKLVLVTIQDGESHFDAIFEGRPDAIIVLAKDVPLDAIILDVHVFDSSTQQNNLDACDVNNFGCQHICLPKETPQCACHLGYELATDGKACTTNVLSQDFTLVLDGQYGHIYQFETNVQPVTLRRIDIASANRVVAMTYDDIRKTLTWVDGQTNSIRRMDITGGNEHTLTGSDFLETSVMAVDVTNGLVYVSKDRHIYTVDASGQKTVLLDESSIQDIVKSVAVSLNTGKLAWLEGESTPRVMRSNLDGSNVQTVVAYDVDKIASPEVIKFDQSDGMVIYWCDSSRDTIEKIDNTLSSVVIYRNRGHNPVAFDVDGNNVYYIPSGRRSIYIIDKTTGAEVSEVMKTPLLGAIYSIHVSRQITLPTTTTTTDPLATTSQSGVEKTTTSKNEFPVIPVAAGAGGGLIVLIIVIVIVARCKRKESEKQAMRRPSALPTVPEVIRAEDMGRAAFRDYASIGGPSPDPPSKVVWSILRQAMRRPSALPTVPEVIRAEDMGRAALRDYASLGGLSPDPPPRPLTKEEEQDGGVYHYIDLDETALRVDLPEKEKDRKPEAGRRGSDRYSQLPGYGGHNRDPPGYGGPNRDYLNPVARAGQEYPKPDYDIDGTRNPYLDLTESGRERLGMTDNRFLWGSVNSGFSDSDGYLTSSIANSRVEYSRQPRETRDFSDESVKFPSVRGDGMDRNGPYQRDRRDFSNESRPPAHMGGWHDARSGQNTGFSGFSSRR